MSEALTLHQKNALSYSGPWPGPTSVNLGKV